MRKLFWDATVAQCGGCAVIKLHNAFGPANTKWKQYRPVAYRCKICAATAEKARYKRTGPTKARRNSWFKTMYNISSEDRAALLLAQDSKCAICREPLEEFGKKTHLDHNHSTGKVRGVLCRLCNMGLGKFKDSLEILRMAVKYMETTDG